MTTSWVTDDVDTSFDHAPLWRPHHTVLGIWAHPDDEAYLSAGLMARTVRGGGRVVCVHATSGEHGTDDPVRWPPSRLRPLRRRELEASVRELGVTEHEVLDHADGGCAEVDPAPTIRRLEDTIARLRPDVIVTFGPDGITEHPDHIAVSTWTTAAWCKTRRGHLLYATSTESFLAKYRDMHQRLDLFPPDAPCVPDDHVALTVRLDPDELDVKRRALAAHASQTTTLAEAMGEEQYRHWYETETFRVPTATDLRSAVAASGTSNGQSTAGSRSRKDSAAGSSSASTPSGSIH